MLRQADTVADCVDRNANNNPAPAKPSCCRPEFVGICAGLVAFCVVHGLFLAATWLSVACCGTGLLDTGLFLLLFCAICAAATLLGSFLSLFIPAWRLKCRPVFAASSVYLLLFVLLLRPMGQMEWKIRAHGFRQLAHRSKPLIEAIRAYERKYGKPPERLPALVPEFLPGIPGTGMAAYPDYEYDVIAVKDNENCGNPWVLYVNTSSGFLNFDSFLYHPNGRYPEEGYGGVLERIDDWAYVHE